MPLIFAGLFFSNMRLVKIVCFSKEKKSLYKYVCLNVKFLTKIPEHQEWVRGEVDDFRRLKTEVRPELDGFG